MKTVNLKINASKEQVVSMLSDNDKVNDKVKFDDSLGNPFMHVKEKDSTVKITCEFLGKPRKDNAFLVGTYFFGKIKEREGVTTLKGVVWTAPVYHLFMFILFGVFIWQCIRVGGFSPIPIILLVFDFFMFKDEFKKQGYIKRYILRAFRRLN